MTAEKFVTIYKFISVWSWQRQVAIDVYFISISIMLRRKTHECTLRCNIFSFEFSISFEFKNRWKAVFFFYFFLQLN